MTLPRPLPPAAITLLCAVTAVGLTGCSTVPSSYDDPEAISLRNAAHNIKIQVVNGFDFNGCDALLVPPTTTTANPPAKPAEIAQFDRLLRFIPGDLAAKLAASGLVPTVVTDESTSPAGTNAFVLETTVIGYYAGSAAERVLIGFGAGSPYLTLRGRLSNRATHEPALFFVAKRGFEGLDRGIDDEAILRGEIKDMTTDLVDVLRRVKEHRPLR